MDTLSHDFETYSDVDLRKVGGSRYARHPSTEVLMCSYALNDEPVKLWVPAEGEPMPEDLRRAWLDPNVVKRAWNAAFERTILKHVLGLDIPVEQWRCTMVLSMSLSLPGKLKEAGPVVQLEADYVKMAKGDLLIRKFCVPRKPTKTKSHTRCDHRTDPEKWEEFKEYCIRDTESERAIYKKLRKFELSDQEWEYYQLDQKINDRGMPIRIPAVENAVKLVNEFTEDRLARLYEITGLPNPNSNAQLLPWLQERGYPYNDMRKGHVKAAWKEAESALDPTAFDPEYIEALEIKSEISRTSVKKYGALLEGSDEDGNLRGAFQFNGAGRTGRFSGRRFQPQNLAKPEGYLEKIQYQMALDLECMDISVLQSCYKRPMDMLSGAIRTSVQPPVGHVLLDADLNAIENRVLGWLAGDDKILAVFDEGRDPYLDFATFMFGQSYEELYEEYKVKGDKTKRTLAKPGVLGGGYMLGAGQAYEDPETGEIRATGLLGYAWNMGISMTSEQAEHSVRVFRETYSDVVQLWYDLEAAAKRCVRTHRPQTVGKLRFEIKSPFLQMILPSGRPISYFRPRLVTKMMPWGKEKEVISYEGFDDRRRWGRIYSSPGKLVENATQAAARDVLLHGMKLADEASLDICLHVHDQIVAVHPEEDAEKGLQTLIQCMEETPAWAPGLPLAAEGSTAKCFMKG